MAKKKEPEIPVYLGDEKFNKNLSVYYSWILPVVLFLVSLVMFFDRAFVTGLTILLLAAFLAPVFKKYLKNIPAPLKLLVVIALILSFYYSMYLNIK